LTALHKFQTLILNHHLPVISKNNIFGYATGLLIIFLTYYLSGWAGLQLSTFGQQITLIWPPTGIALFALLAWGIRMWPAIWLGALLVNLHMNPMPAPALAISIGNTLGPVLAAYLLKRLEFSSDFRTPRDVFLFIGIGSLACMAINATVGSLSLVLAGVLSVSVLPLAWLTWWLGDALGVLLVGSALLSLLKPLDEKLLASTILRLDTIFVWIGAILTGLLTSSPLAPFRSGAVPYLVFPFIVWLALKANIRQTAWAALFLSGMAIWGVLSRTGYFVDAQTGKADLPSLWSYIFLLGLTGLLVSALRSENIQALNKSRRSEASLKEAERIAQVGNWELDLVTNHLTWSDEIYHLFEIDKEKFGATYESFLNAIHPEDREKVNVAYTESLESRMPYQITHRLLMADGRVKWVEERCTTDFDEQHKPLRSFGTVQDVTARKHAEEELKLAGMVFENIDEGVLVTDEENNIIAVNRAFTDITGYSLEEVKSKNPRIFQSGYHNEAFYQAMWQAINTKGYWSGEIWDKRRNGEMYAKQLSINTIRNKDGSVHRYVALFYDITEKKKSDELIWRQANYDALTDLPNRRMFHDRLEQEARKSQRSGRPLAVLLIDLDRFKEVNDSLGHDKGDLLLVDAAQRIRSCVRESDTVARLGGDEFIIILSELDDIDIGNIDRVAQDIIGKLSLPFNLGPEEAFISATIGISLYPNDSLKLGDLLKNADQAMYSAKNAGRNRFGYFTHDMQAAAQKRLHLANELRTALTQNQFKVYFQPIVNLASGRIYKAEALIRWQHPEHGIIHPMNFIPLAEENGLIVPIGDWVFRQAVQQVKLWRSKYKSFQISVNKSPLQMSRNVDFSWADHLQQEGVPGRAIAIEITEGLLLNAEPEINRKLLEFRDAGIKVAIDDFGTGYSSLSYLKKFDIDYLKIDKSFVDHLGQDADDLALCEAIIVMAHKLGLKVIAEGVETTLQHDLLHKAGCDYAQGYLYSKPVPAAEFEKLLV
jgi:diguanylate cyclase (GGDEF)-like protein/PAS domain S-box-containing protein